MKILIGYDGSEGADVGIEGLRRAGLPPQNVEALVVTVAEVCRVRRKRAKGDC